MPWLLRVTAQAETPLPTPHRHSTKIKLDLWDEALIQHGKMASVCNRDFICDTCGEKFRVPFGDVIPGEG